MSETTKKQGLRPARRTLVKGAAWAVPTVVVASAAPAMAVSQDVTITDLHQACKLPGASCEGEVGVTKGYAIRVQVCSTAREDVTITFGNASVSLDGKPATGGWSIKPNPLKIEFDGAAPSCETVVLGIQGEPNSKNVSISGSAPYTWAASDGSGPSGSGTLTFSAAATPPCVDCAP